MPSIIHLFGRQDPDPLAGMTFPETDDHRPEIIAASVVGTVLAILSTLGRIAARRRTKASIQADDWWIIGGTFMALGVVASTLAMVHFGLGRHIDKVTSPAGLVQSVVTSQILYSLSIVPIKLSILALYHRLFPSPNLKLVSLGLAILTVLYSVAQAIVMGLQCIPLEALWNPKIQNPTCLNMSPFYTSMAIINVATDCAILTLPIPYIWRLSLQKARKVQVLAVFMTGAAVTAFGIIRAVNVGSASPIDQSWSDVPAATWSVLEICVGVVSANLPCLRPLFWWLPSSIRGSTGGTESKARAYAVSNKRQSINGNGYEMARRSRVMGANKAAEWESFDDNQALTQSIDEPSNEKSSSISDIEALPQHGNRTAMVSSPVQAHAPGMGSHAPPRGIVVSTTIETSYDAHDGGAFGPRGAR